MSAPQEDVLPAAGTKAGRCAAPPPGARRIRRSRRAAFAALAVSFAIVFTLGALEVAARYLTRPKTAPPPSAVFGRPKQWMPRYRAEGIALGKESGEFRLVVIGDSMSWGWRLHPEDAWPSRLEWRLRPLIRPSIPFRVLNAARPNWNTVQTSQNLVSRIDDLRPDAVLLGFCLNDTEPNSPAERAQLDAMRRTRKPEHPLSIWLHRTSALYRTVWTRLENRRLDRVVARIFRDTFEEDSATWRAAVRALLRMRDELDRRHIPFLVVILPFFDDPFDARYPNRAYHQQLERTCAVHGLDCIDFLPLFEGHDVGRLAIEPHFDGHPNEAAQRMIADALVEPLLARGMLPVARDNRGSVVVHGCRIDVSLPAPPRKRRGQATAAPPVTAPPADTDTAPETEPATDTDAPPATEPIANTTAPPEAEPPAEGNP